MSANFAVRLRCPLCEADSWITLANREEYYEQILQGNWDFECREHGAQRGSPKEVIEVAPLDETAPQQTRRRTSALVNSISTAETEKIRRSSERMYLRIPVVVYGYTKNSGAFHEEAVTHTVNASGALVILKTKLQIGDSVFMVRKGSGQEQEVRVAYLESYSERETKVGLAFRRPIPDFWSRSRKQPRIPKTLRVVVRGTDSRGHPFKQSSYTIDLSHDGARLDGIGFLTTPGQTIEVHRLWRKKNFRVVWIGQIGTSEANQVGIFGLAADKDMWHASLPEGDGSPGPGNPTRPKK